MYSNGELQHIMSKFLNKIVILTTYCLVVADVEVSSLLIIHVHGILKGTCGQHLINQLLNRVSCKLLGSFNITHT